MSNIVTLNDKQLDYAISKLNEKEKFNMSSTCFCGYYEVFIENIGILVIDIVCKENILCPAGMEWFVKDQTGIWDATLNNLGVVLSVEEMEAENFNLLGYLNKEQSKILKETVRKSFIRDYSPYYKDEYNNSLLDSEYKLLTTANHNLKVLNQGENIRLIIKKKDDSSYTEHITLKKSEALNLIKILENCI